MNPREIILRDVWEYIADEDDLSWIDNVASQPADNRPMGDFGEITRRMLAAGISKRDIARFAKINGYEAAFGVLYKLEGDNGTDDKEPTIYWKLQAFDAVTDRPIEAGLGGLHESVLSADPTGREMGPPTGT
jgi:hypothetical protein